MCLIRTLSYILSHSFNVAGFVVVVIVNVVVADPPPSLILKRESFYLFWNAHINNKIMHPHIWLLCLLASLSLAWLVFFMLRAPFYYQIKELGVRINKLKSDDDKLYIFFYVTHNIKETQHDRRRRKKWASEKKGKLWIIMNKHFERKWMIKYSSMKLITNITL